MAAFIVFCANVNTHASAVYHQEKITVFFKKIKSVIACEKNRMKMYQNLLTTPWALL